MLPPASIARTVIVCVPGRFAPCMLAATAAPAVIVPSIAIATLTIGVNLLIDNLPQKIRDRSE